jgi:hypothetical protein
MPTATTTPMFSIAARRDGGPPPLAVVLGTGDIASAVAWHLHRAGTHAVLLLRDTAMPVLRRGMAFDDAIEMGQAEVQGVTALRQFHPGHQPNGTVPLVSPGNLALALSALPSPALLVDVQLRKYAEIEDLRALAPLAIGVGPGFVGGGNVHLAVESLPGAEGHVVSAGPTAVPSGQAVPLGGAGAERFVYAPRAGTWAPVREIGTVVAAGDDLGVLSGEVVAAPIAGTIRGLVRPRPGLPRGAKLAEIDPRPDAAWRGIAPRANRIGRGVLMAVHAAIGQRDGASAPTLSALAAE